MKITSRAGCIECGEEIEALTLPELTHVAFDHIAMHKPNRPVTSVLPYFPTYAKCNHGKVIAIYHWGRFQF